MNGYLAGGRFGILAPGQRIHHSTSAFITDERDMPSSSQCWPNTIQGSSGICVERGGVVRRLGSGTGRTVVIVMSPPQREFVRQPGVTCNVTCNYGTAQGQTGGTVTRNGNEDSTHPRQLAGTTGVSDETTREGVSPVSITVLSPRVTPSVVCDTCVNGCDCIGGVDPACEHYGCWGRSRNQAKTATCPGADPARARIDRMREQRIARECR